MEEETLAIQKEEAEPQSHVWTMLLWERDGMGAMKMVKFDVVSQIGKPQLSSNGDHLY